MYGPDAARRGNAGQLGCCTAAPAEEIRTRQEAMAELRPLLDLREDLALLAAGVPAGVDFDAVARLGRGRAGADAALAALGRPRPRRRDGVLSGRLGGGVVRLP